MVVWVVFSAPQLSAATCDSVARLKSPKATIVAAHTVASGAFRLPTLRWQPAPDFFSAFNTLRAFCRVQGIIQPSADSHITFEVWLPESGWNGKYEGAGNGTYGGTINYYRLAEAVNAGYAGPSTDTGHQGIPSDRSWALGHPEKIADFSFRAIHETAEITKEIIRSYYGEMPKRSYFSSCSNGGRQGLMEAQRYPADYDGILIGAPWFPGILTSNPDLQTADGQLAFNLDPSNANLSAFKQRGGKLILYHGENDAPGPTVDYYKRVVSTLGPAVASEFIRLYIVPGMGHCGGGETAGEFGQRLDPHASPRNSVSAALDLWIESGIAPDRIIAAKYKIDGTPSSGEVRTRPLCPYPQVARYSGSGNVDDAANFVCTEER
jgi:hypothetical protein